MVELRYVLLITIGVVVSFSGCTGGQDVTSVFKALPEVQQFMKEHPDAQITVTYWSKEEVTQSAQEISQQCDKPITPVAMYKATVSEGDLKIISWINAENQIVMCSTTSGSILTSPKTTPSTSSKIDENKVFDLDVRQIIIDDSEIKKIIGTGWTKLEEDGKSIFTLPSSSQRTNVGYENIDTATREKEKVGIVLVILPNITAAKDAYSGMLSAYREIKTDVNIGDDGKAWTSKEELSYSMILFRKNNFIALIISTVGHETAYKLAKEQEEKLIRILDND